MLQASGALALQRHGPLTRAAGTMLRRAVADLSELFDPGKLLAGQPPEIALRAELLRVPDLASTPPGSPRRRCGPRARHAGAAGRRAGLPSWAAALDAALGRAELLAATRILDLADLGLADGVDGLAGRLRLDEARQRAKHELAHAARPASVRRRGHRSRRRDRRRPAGVGGDP
jgi:hypothetical protein